MFPLVQLIFKQRLSQSKIPIKRIQFIARFGYLITIYNGIRYVHCEHAHNQYHPRPGPGRTERFLLSKYISSVVFFISCITHNENSTIYQTLVSVLVPGSKELITTAINSTRSLTFRHRASSLLGQAFRYSPENAFYIFNQQIYFII